MLNNLSPAKVSSVAASTNDLISKKRAEIEGMTNLGSQVQQQQQQKIPVKKMLETFEHMHMADDDDDDEGDGFILNKDPRPKSLDVYNKPLSEAFSPPPLPTSIGNEQRINVENDLIKAAKNQNAAMGFEYRRPPQRQPQPQQQQQSNDTTPLWPSNQRPSAEAFSMPLWSAAAPTPAQMGAPAGSYEGAAAYATKKMQDLDLGSYDTNASTPSPQSHELYLKNMLNNNRLPNNQPRHFMANQGNQMQEDGDILMKKLNYITHMLEKQQDDKMGSAPEEIVLYSFLGVFMIFIVDSFTKVGKYVR